MCGGLAEQIAAHPTQVHQRKEKLLTSGEEIVSQGVAAAAHSEQESQKLLARIAQLTMEKDLLSNAFGRNRKKSAA